MVNRCVILSASPDADADLVRKLVEPDDFVVAADGGYRLAVAAGITPSLTVGDFDSLIGQPAGETVTLPRRKDETDTMAAVKLGWERGYRRFLLLGATGGRPDHAFANLAAMAWIASHGGEAEACDRYGTRRMVTAGRYVLPKGAHTVFSLFAFGGEVADLVIKDAAYTLDGITLSPADPLGVSNRFLAGDATVSFASGMLLIFLTND